MAVSQANGVTRRTGLELNSLTARIRKLYTEEIKSMISFVVTMAPA